jgi:error-prone DNA polymerase
VVGADGFATLCRAVSLAHAGERGSPQLDAGDLDALASDRRGGARRRAARSDSGRSSARARAQDAAAAELDRWRSRFGTEDTVLGVRDHRVAPGGTSRPMAVPTLRSRVTTPDRPHARARRTERGTGRRRQRRPPRAARGRRRRRRAALHAARGAARRSAPRAHHLGRLVRRPCDDGATLPRASGAARRAADLAERCACTGRSARSGAAAHRAQPAQAAAALVARSRAGSCAGSAIPARRPLARLDRELAAIDDAGLHDLFLAVADVVVDVRAAGILVACRGSAAGSLVCFALGISDVDPVANGLAFERFMNPYRDELPDIDLDVESHRREDVYDLVIARYGEHRVATVGMFETLQARSAVRGVGKVLGCRRRRSTTSRVRLPHLRARDVTSCARAAP